MNHLSYNVLKVNILWHTECRTHHRSSFCVVQCACLNSSSSDGLDTSSLATINILARIIITFHFLLPEQFFGWRLVSDFTVWPTRSSFLGPNHPNTIFIIIFIFNLILILLLFCFNTFQNF